MDTPRSSRQQHAHDAASILVPALKFGTMTGSAGLVVGGVAGVIRNAPPIFFATASGIQWFGLGSTYWGSRSFILQGWDAGNGVTPSEKASASGLAGAAAGSGIALLTRGPRNVLPGGLVFGLFGYAGQAFYNAFNDKSTRQESAQGDETKGNFWQRLGLKKWSPFSVLTDQEYENMLKEKLLRLEADIALVDDKIAVLRIKENEWNVARTKVEAKGLEKD